jgi:hypothetical protein
MSTPDIGLRVEQYIKLRDKINEIKEHHKTELKPFVDTLEQLNGLLLQHLNDTNQDAAKTSAGTVYRSTKETASLADPEAFMEYVIQSGEFELLDRKANKTAVKAFIEENNCAPPGVNFGVSYEVGVRRK